MSGLSDEVTKLGGQSSVAESDRTESASETFPDAQELFELYDIQFFEGVLRDRCKLEWSKKMTTCAGICYYKKHPPTTAVAKASQKLGGVEKLMLEYPQCIIRLSEPLLKFRSVKEMKETIAHEMIHAYCFVFDLEKSRDGHGDVFRKFMNTINQATGLNITVYHSFHDEVLHYKTHVWRCTGPCRTKPPYFGYVRRAQNRAPGPSSYWWAKHQAECGGTYVKESSPDPPPQVVNLSRLNVPKQETLDSLLQRLQPHDVEAQTPKEREREKKRRRVDGGMEAVEISPLSTSSSSAGRRVHIGMAEKLEERRRRKSARRSCVDLPGEAGEDIPSGLQAGEARGLELKKEDAPSTQLNVERAAAAGGGGGGAPVVSISSEEGAMSSSEEDGSELTASKRLADRLAAEPPAIKKIPIRDTPQARAALMRLYGIWTPPTTSSRTARD